MQQVVLVIVLNKPELLDSLLSELNDEGIKGATVIHSVGMGHMLTFAEDSPIISSMRAFFQKDGDENRVIFTVLDFDLLPKAKAVVNRIVGDLSKPNTAIMFAVPTVFVEGITQIE